MRNEAVECGNDNNKRDDWNFEMEFDDVISQPLPEFPYKIVRCKWQLRFAFFAVLRIFQ